MSIVSVNQNIFKKTAIINFNNKKENITLKKDGDFTFIYANNNIVGVNVNNHTKYFESKAGTHSLNKNQLRALKKQFPKINFPENKFFEVGRVLERKVHPKSKHLFVLKIETNKKLQIVTNSLNSLVGTKVIIANIGTTLPSGVEIGEAKVLSIKSQGSLCGFETLNLENKEKVSGIYLEKNKNIGEEFFI